MSTTRVHSSTSTHLKTTNGSSVDEFQIQRLRLAVGHGKARRAVLNLLEELWIGSLSVLQIINSNCEISIFGRERSDPELSLLVGPSGLHIARRERPLHRIVRE